MVFLRNKYTRWYDAIIANRRSQPAQGYVERHHVMPHSLGGSDEHTNIVKLTAREHFVCHRLLIRMTHEDAKRRMIFALHQMVHGTNKSRYCSTSRDYAVIAKLNAMAMSSIQKERFADPVERQKQVQRAKHASDIAAEHNRDNPEFSVACSARNQRLVEAGTHNFIGGHVQKTMWKDPLFRAKQHQLMIDRIETGLHPFVCPIFIKVNKERLKSYWANMTPAERTERGRKISEGRKKKAT